MNKRYLKRPLYHIAGKTAKILRDFQGVLNARLKRKEDEIWHNRFEGKPYFEFRLHQVVFNLYEDSVLSRIIYNGFEEQEINFITTTLKPDDIFLDVGSNIGLFSLIASNIVGEKGKVICFEPSPVTYKRLLENIKLNNFTNIDSRNIGLSDNTGLMTFYTSKNGHDAWDSFAPSADNKLENSIDVNVSTLDNELDTIDKTRISLVKIDVEGWEKFVLKGGETFLKTNSPAVMVEFTEQNTFNAGYPIHEIFDIMQDWGYTWYRITSEGLVLEKKQLRYPYVNLIAKKEQN